MRVRERERDRDESVKMESKKAVKFHPPFIR